MKIKIQVVVELDNGETQVIQEVSKIERSALQPENLGLSIAESKTLLQNIQSTLVERQVAEYLSQNSSCLHCEKKLSLFHHSRQRKDVEECEGAIRKTG